MAILPKLPIPLRSMAVLACLALWACSSSDAGAPDQDAQQNIDSSKAGSATKTDDDSGDDDESSGGGGGRGDEGSGNSGSVDETPPDPGAGGGGSEDEPSSGDSAGAGGGGGEADPDPGTDPDPDPEPQGPSEAFLRGQTFAEQNQCVTCHQANFAGFTVFPNITPDAETGIGSWTDAQIVAAIRDGKDIDGKSLCASMARYPVSDDQAADIVAFLRGLPAVSNRITSECPGHGL